MTVLSEAWRSTGRNKVYARQGAAQFSGTVHAARNSTWLALVLFAVIAFAAYFNSLGVPLLFDDVVHIKNNLHVMSGLGDIGFSPRAWTYFTCWVNSKLHGFEWLPGWHLFNIAVHVAVAFMVYLLVIELGRAAGKTIG